MYIYSLDFAFFDCLLFMSKLFKGPFRFYPGSIGCNFVFYFYSRQGIGEDGFVLFLGNTPIIKRVYFDDIDSMALFDGKIKICRHTLPLTRQAIGTNLLVFFLEILNLSLI